MSPGTASGTSDSRSSESCSGSNTRNGTVPVRRTAHNGDSKERKEGEEEEEKSPDEGFMGMTPLLQAHHAMEKMEEFVHKMWEGRWRVIPHDVLPDWLKDNDFLLHGHRPPMPSFRACFKSIFRIHTETGNIWTHLLGKTHMCITFNTVLYYTILYYTISAVWMCSDCIKYLRLCFVALVQ
uniref:Adiponectin receptor 2 n=1 Tax=Astyanax mexicanus TaxID=7994 RepID=A0A8B9K185_ASTMX